MNEHDKGGFTALLTGTAVFYEREITTFTFATYWEALKQYRYTDIEIAFKKHFKQGRYMPKPVDIIYYIEGTQEECALLAWSKVMNAIRLHGTYVSVIFDDPIIHAVLRDMGGWVVIGSITDKELPFQMKEFKDRYMSYLTSGCFNYPRRLSGIGAMGETRLIGEQNKCDEVFNGGIDCSRGLIKIETQPSSELLDGKKHIALKQD